ncbi:MAG: Rhs element Vgr protein [Gammaproteobacteria bacterium]|nr:MAG: Rhs element Vgr protein [Gammaproteobacteria bacterium]
MPEDRRIPTPAPADLPSFKILIGGSQVSAEYQVQALTISRSFNRVAEAQLLILDGDPAAEDFMVSAGDDFIPGNEIQIQVGYHGNEESLFTGLIVRHGIQARSQRPSLLKIECKDAAVKLTVQRNSSYFYDATDGEIIEQIAAAAGLTADVEATTVTHEGMVQYYASDWDFVLMRAEANGRQVSTVDGKLVVKAPDGAGDPVLNLTYGGNILDFEAHMDARDQFDTATAHAWDPANQEMQEVEGADAVATSPGNVSEAELAAVVGLDGRTLSHGGQLVETELQAWADGQRLKSGYSKVRGRVRIQGFGQVVPGDKITLNGVGDRFNGDALVSGVRHELSAKNWETDISFGLDPAWFGVERRDLVEAPVGGLLPGVNGLQIGLVTALADDPAGENRIQVRLPMIDPAEEGVWARIATLDAGEERGSFFLPEIGDEVIIGFLYGDPRNPIMLGMLNSSAKPAPLAASDDNHEKGFVTRSGIKLLFNDDTSTFTLETPNGNRLIVDDSSGSVTLEDESGNLLKMESSGVTIESVADINIKASGDVNIEGTSINIAAATEAKIEGSAGAEISSGGSTVVKGSIVQIN